MDTICSKCGNSRVRSAEMTDGIEIGPNVIQFEDESIAVRILDFNPENGHADVHVQKKAARIGFYYITVQFLSGDSTRLDYDGANPNIPISWDVRTSHPNDVIGEVQVRKVR
jgi:hypothetical protein